MKQKLTIMMALFLAMDSAYAQFGGYVAKKAYDHFTGKGKEGRTAAETVVGDLDFDSIAKDIAGVLLDEKTCAQLKKARGVRRIKDWDKIIVAGKGGGIEDVAKEIVNSISIAAVDAGMRKADVNPTKIAESIGSVVRKKLKDGKGTEVLASVLEQKLELARLDAVKLAKDVYGEKEVKNISAHIKSRLAEILTDAEKTWKRIEAERKSAASKK